MLPFERNKDARQAVETTNIPRALSAAIQPPSIRRRRRSRDKTGMDGRIAGIYDVIIENHLVSYQSRVRIGDRPRTRAMRFWDRTRCSRRIA